MKTMNTKAAGYRDDSIDQLPYMLRAKEIYEKMKQDTVMISQPMAGFSEESIKEVRRQAEEYLEKLGYRVIDTYFEDEWANPDNMKKRGVVHIPVAFLAKAIEKMAECDAVYFCRGWRNARGCVIEHEIASQYNIKIIDQELQDNIPEYMQAANGGN